MARAIVTSRPERRPPYEPLYDTDTHTGASIEVFYADCVLARSFGAAASGWFHWRCLPGSLPDGPPIGPFRAWCDALNPRASGNVTGRSVNEQGSGLLGQLLGARGRPAKKHYNSNTSVHSWRRECPI
jgi:hypothetical protein